MLVVGTPVCHRDDAVEQRDGVVDESWAREHHELWYEKVKAGTVTQHFITSAAPSKGPVGTQ